jgi:hypothetical protein
MMEVRKYRRHALRSQLRTLLVILVVLSPVCVVWFWFGMQGIAIGLATGWAFVTGFPAAVYLQRAARKFSCPQCARALPCEKKGKSLIFPCRECGIQWDVGMIISGD